MGPIQARDLFRGTDVMAVIGDLRAEVTGVRYDSRAVEPGDAFFCVRGFVHDGHDFAAEALARGARVVVVEGQAGLERVRAVAGAATASGGAATASGGATPGSGAAVIVAVASVRHAMGLAAAAFFGQPSSRLRVIGVTGTNGKTTTTHLVREILVAQGRPCGLIGTVHSIVGGKSLPAVRTTPEAFDLQSLAADMVRAGDACLSLEVGSHALSLERTVGFEFDLAVFTNLTQDHLDFHGTMEEYFRAKAALFESLGRSRGAEAKAGRKAAILNADDPYGRRLAGLTAAPVTTYGLTSEDADLRATDLSFEPRRTGFTLTAREALGGAAPGMAGFQERAELSLTGRHNVANALAAVAVALVEGVSPRAVVASLSSLRGAAGRFERVDAGQDFTVVVDYAHTPDGLENVLRAARALRPRRVITVFGCGGDRDRTKRPLMGEKVANLSDLCVVTSDNPRSERPEAIIDDIRPGLERAGRKEGTGYVAEPDRAKAIALAVQTAGPGDLVLVTGKGHETYQIFADRTIHFDDREVLGEAIRVKLGRPDRRPSGTGGDSAER